MVAHAGHVMFRRCVHAGFVIALCAPAQFAQATQPNFHLSTSYGIGMTRHWEADQVVTPYSRVNMVSGQLYTEIPIVSWNGKGPEIDFRLYHNSGHVGSSIFDSAHCGFTFGPGWTCSYSGRISFQGLSNQLYVLEDDGTLLLYTRNGTGNTWLPPAGHYDVLTRLGQTSYTWKLTRKDGSYRRFDADGRLREIFDTAGNQVTITYDWSGGGGTGDPEVPIGEGGENNFMMMMGIGGGEPENYCDWPTHIKEITDAAGRKLVFNWDFDTCAFLGVTAPGSRTWTFAFDASSRLNTITDPMSFVTRIEYTSAGRITKVIDPEADSQNPKYYFQIDYNTSGAAVNNVYRVVDPYPDNNGNQQFIWGDSTQNEYDQTFTDRRGQVWTYRIKKSNRSLLRLTEPCADDASTNYYEEWSSRDSNLNPLSYRNQRGNAWTWQYDSKGNKTQITDPLSNVTVMQYHSTFNTMTRREDPDTASPSRRVWTWSYDSTTGNLLEERDPYAQSGATQPTPPTGLPAEPTHGPTTYTYYNGADHPQWNGKLKQTTDRRGVITRYEYDSYGQLAKEIVGFDGLALTTETTTDVRSLVTSVINPRGIKTKYDYNTNGWLITVIEDMGASPHLNLTYHYSYYKNGERESYTNARGRKTTYFYNWALGKLVLVCDPARDCNTSIDAAADVYCNTNAIGVGSDPLAQPPDCHWERTGISPFTQIDGNGFPNTTTLDCHDRAIQQTDGLGHSTYHKYDGAGNRTSTVNRRGIETTWTYDALNRRTGATVDPTGLNIHTEYAYGVPGGSGCTCSPALDRNLVRKTTDAEGEITFYEYDLLDRLTKVVRKFSSDPNTPDTAETADGDDAVTTYFYDAMGRLLERRQLNSPNPDYAIRYSYDNAGRRTSRTILNGSAPALVVVYYPDANGNIAQADLPNGNTISLAYDNVDRVTTISDELGPIETLDYDSNGNITARTDGLNHATTYTYDSYDRLYEMLDPLSNSTKFVYDRENNLYSVQTPRGRWIGIRYDANYRVSNYSLDNQFYMSNRVSFSYDYEGNVTQQIAANGALPAQLTRYEYDAANRRTLEEYPDSETDALLGVAARQRWFTYFKTGEVGTRLDQNGDLTTYTYDDLHRLTQRAYTISQTSPTYPSAQGPDTYAYDRVGRLTSGLRADPGPAPEVAISFSYDYAGRVTQSVQDGKTIALGYVVDGAADNFYQQTTYPGATGAADGRVVRHIMDARGRVSRIANLSGGSPTNYATNSYDLADRLVERLFGNGTKLVREYDDADRVTRDAHLLPPAGQNPAVAFEDRRYGRNAVGNRTWMENLVKPEFSEWYGYDNYDRLRDFKRGTLNTAMTDVTAYTSNVNVTQRQQWSGMDVLGNWLTTLTTQDGVTTTDARTHNDANEILSRDLSTNGQASGSPIAFSHDDNGNMANDGQFLYDYDVENRITRARRVLPGSPPQVEVVGEYYYDAIGRRVRKVVSNCGAGLNGDYAWIWTMRWQLMQVWRDNGGGDTIEQEFVIAGPTAYVDDQIARHDASTSVQYLHGDHMESYIAATNASGLELEKCVSDPYGRTFVFDALWQYQSGSLLGLAFGHQGLPIDRETGATYNRWRQLDSVLGRFDQRDSLGYAFGMSLFESRLANPLAWLDATGRAPIRRPEPAPTNPDGSPKPPAIPCPPTKDGRPNEWVPVKGTDERSIKWKPRDPVCSDKGGQPSVSWDEEGHWDKKPGDGGPTERFDENGNPISPAEAHERRVPNAPPGAAPNPAPASPETEPSGWRNVVFGVTGAGLFILGGVLIVIDGPLPIGDIPGGACISAGLVLF